MTNIIEFPDKDSDSFPVYVDGDGNKWHPYLCNITLGGHTQGVEVWAKSPEHAMEILRAAPDGEVCGRISKEIPA